MAKIGAQALRDIGLTSNFARLVLFMGKMALSCLNNPHESAYHCGACSGSPGGPNARALATMLNDLRVRRRLQESGIDIPEGTSSFSEVYTTLRPKRSPSTIWSYFHLLKLLAYDGRGRSSDKQQKEMHTNDVAVFESEILTLKPSDALFGCR